MHTWKVFVSDFIFVQLKSCFLLGECAVVKKTLVITGATESNIPAPGVVGFLRKFGEKLNTQEKRFKDFFIEVHEENSCELSYELWKDGKKLPCIVIIFDSKQIGQSSVISYHSQSGNEISVLQELKECFRKQKDLRSSLLYDGFQKLLDVPFGAFCLCIKKVSTLFGYLWKVPWVGNILLIPSSCKHVRRKITQIEKWDKSTENKIWKHNAALRQVVDSLIGILVIMCFLQFDGAKYLAESTLGWGDEIADDLTRLLQWLKGNPGGLKLNRHLTYCLSHIFQYHVYLWKSYLTLMQPGLPCLLWFCSFIGVLGVTFQICLLQDILSIMSIHVYCFYVYAARLYRLQVFTLSALWRLFRGRKWNILRNRVDSASFDVDQLFVGTLIFTILLFLLPTTLLYYTVFTLLRLAVLFVQGCLWRAVHLLNTWPIYSIVLWVVNSDIVKYEAEYVKKLNSRNSLSHFVMKMKRPQFSKLSNLCDKSVENPSDSWQNFLSSLLKGHLVYPWVTEF